MTSASQSQVANNVSDIHKRNEWDREDVPWSFYRLKRLAWDDDLFLIVLEYHNKTETKIAVRPSFQSTKFSFSCFLRSSWLPLTCCVFFILSVVRFSLAFWLNGVFTSTVRARHLLMICLWRSVQLGYSAFSSVWCVLAYRTGALVAISPSTIGDETETFSRIHLKGLTLH